MIASNTIDSAKDCIVWPPGIPQEFDQGDADRNANPGDYAEKGNADEADNRQPELPWLNAKNATQVCKFEQADGCSDHDCRERTTGKILQQVGCEQQKERDRDSADRSSDLRLSAGRFGHRCA